MYTPRRTSDYEKLVRLAFYDQVGWGDRPPHEGPVSLTVRAFFPMPKARPKWWKKAAEDFAPLHISRPDVDNVLKIIADALNGVLWKDDRQINAAKVEKYYSRESRCVVMVDLMPLPRSAVWRTDA